MMRLSVRVFAVAVLGCFLLTTAFAEDAVAPAKNKKETAKVEANAGGTAATTPPATEAPAPPAPPSSAWRSDKTPVVDIFGGYSFIRNNIKGGLCIPLPVSPNPCPPQPPATDSNGPFNMHGGTGQVTGNIRDWFGLTADFGVYSIRELNPGSSGRVFTYLFGPTFTSRRSERWTPFVHTLFGAANLHGSSPLGTLHTNVFAAALGGGLDVNLNRNVGVRLFQAEYLLTKFKDGVPPGSGTNRQNGVRLSAGLVLRFGYPSAPPPIPVNGPPVASCSATPNMVIAGSGDVVIVRAQASDPDNDPLTYAWSTTGGSVDGSGPEVRWNAGNASPGTYTVTAAVNDGHNHTVNCSADITVNAPPNHPPTMSCSVDQASVISGQTVRVTANASDPDGDPLTYRWRTSGGQITGSGPSVTLNTRDAQGPVTIQGHVDDGRGGTADCQTSVDVRPATLTLRSVYFVTGRPTKKDPNGGLVASQKQTLDFVAGEFKKYLSFKPDARLMLDGYADIRKYAGGHDSNEALTERRAARAKSYLVEQGVPASNLDTNAHGDHQQLSEAQVRGLVESSPELSAEERGRMLNRRNMHTIWLANNRRVDMTLESSGQQSVQEYPFNAADLLTLIGGREKPKTEPPARKPRGKRTGTKKTGTAPAATHKAGTRKGTGKKKK